MQNVKMCVRCNAAIISNIHNENTDFYRHIRVKYCDQCRPIVKREQTAARVRKLKARKKAEAKLTKDRLELLEQENEVLRKNIDNYLLLLDFIGRAVNERGAEND